MERHRQRFMGHKLHGPEQADQLLRSSQHAPPNVQAKPAAQGDPLGIARRESNLLARRVAMVSGQQVLQELHHA